MSDIPGLSLENVFLMCVSYALILLINRVTSSRSAILLVAILTFHHTVAYLFSFYLDMPRYEGDPAGFIRLANGCSTFGYCGYFGEHLYANYLARVLALGESIYFVFLLNVLFFVISLFYFIRISELLSLKGNRRTNIFLYSMWPSVVYFTTLNYREPFELYLLIVAVYFGLSGSKSDSFLRMLVSMILLFLMGMFHIKGLVYLSPVLFLILVCYKFPFTVISVSKKIILIIIMSVAVYLSQGMHRDYLYEVSRSMMKSQVENKISDNKESHTEKEKTPSARVLLFEKNKNIFYKNRNYHTSEPGYADTFMRKVIFYRESLFWVRPPRTAFVSKISDSSIPKFIASYFLVYMEYLFAPFIFQINSFLGLLAYAESVFRVLLFASTLLLLKRRPEARVLFVIYLAITAMWAIGVVSYGAAIRHHIQTNWILVLLGVPMIAEYIRRKFRLNDDKLDVLNR